MKGKDSHPQEIHIFGMKLPLMSVYIAAGLMLLVVIIGIFAPWGDLESNGSMGGVKADANADFYCYKTHYNVQADTSGIKGGTAYQLGLGLASSALPANTGGGLGQNLGGNITREGDLNYYNPDRTVLQGDAGIMYNSFSYKTYKYILISQDVKLIYVKVETQTDTVPWWVAGMEQECRITLSIAPENKEDFQQVTVNKVWLEVWTGYDEKTTDYSKRAYQAEVQGASGDTIKKTGVNADGNATYNNLTYAVKVKLGSDDFDPYETVGVVGRVSLSLKDSKGDPELDTAEPATKTTPPSTINVLVMPTEDAASVLGFLLVFPIYMLALLMLVFSVGLFMAKKRPSSVFAFVAGALFLLCPLLFVLGAGSIMDLIIFDDTTVTYGAGVFLSAVAGIGVIVMGVLMRASFPKPSMVVVVVADKPKKNGAKPKKGGTAVVSVALAGDEAGEQGIPERTKHSKKGKPKKNGVEK